jgi:ketosteroid isomerase-like protein
MKLTRYLPLVIFILQLSCEGKMENSIEKANIRQLRDKSNLAIAQQDTLSLSEIWSEDFLIISSTNAEVKGKIANRRLFANEFNTKKEVLYVRTPTEIEVFSDWSMASELGKWRGEWQASDGMVQLEGTYFAKWTKIDGSWKLKAEIFVPTSCSGSKFCDTQKVIISN